MREQTFQIEGTPKISFRLPLGEARIIEGSPGQVGVQLEGRSADRFVIEMRGDEVVIEPEGTRLGRWSTIDLRISIGEPAEVRARLAAADFFATARLASVQVDTASGDVTVGDVDGDVAVKAAAGDIRVSAASGDVTVTAASGDLKVERVGGAANLKSASGDVFLGECDGEVSAKSASGDVSIGLFSGPWLDVKSLSGDVIVGVPGGRAFDVSFQTLSGEVRTDFPVSEGGDNGKARLAVKTMSGDIVIQKGRGSE